MKSERQIQKNKLRLIRETNLGIRVSTHALTEDNKDYGNTFITLLISDGEKC